MEIITNPTQDEIKKAAKALKNGHLVAFPTETVYGLGADATNEKAVSRIYSVKGRPTDHPLIVHISSINQLDRWAVEIPEYAIELAKEFWPGPMTLILKRSDLPKNFITGAQDSVGIRVPGHPIALALLKHFEKIGGLGIAAPSANKFGAISPTSFDDVIDDIGDDLEQRDFILNGGNCSVGIESTIINCLGETPSILRPGSITRETITEFLKLKDSSYTHNDKIKAPGNLEKHYSPNAKVLINNYPKKGEGLIALNNIETPVGVKRLLAPTNLAEYAVGLYEALRQGDRLNLAVINIYTPENNDLGAAIIDRVKKASG